MSSLFEEIAPSPADDSTRTPGHHHRQRRAAHGRHRAPAAAGPPAAPGLPAHRHPHRLRHHQLRRLHGALRRPAGQELHDARGAGRRPRGHDRRGPGHGQRAAPDPGGVQGRARPAVRLLHARDDARRQGPAGREPRPDRGRDPLGAVGQPVPLHRLPEHRQGGAVGRRTRCAARRERPNDRRRGRARRRTVAGAGRDQDRRHGREPPPGRGQPVHPRHGQLHRRHRAARHAAHGDPAQPVGARADHDRSTPARPGRFPASGWS